jgi:HAD superfamily hydrolase (TIGR01509 family)
MSSDRSDDKTSHLFYDGRMSLPIGESIASGETYPINLKEFIPPGVTTAILDMDGLMINSPDLDNKVIAVIMHNHGVDIHDAANPWTAEDEAGMLGLSLPDMFQRVITKYGLDSTVDAKALSDEFYPIMLHTLEREPLEPMPGLINLVTDLEAVNFKLAIASSARRKKIDIVLHKLKLEDKFAPDAIVSGEDDIEHGKPAPDIYLEAARKVGSKPEQCIGFEDAENGVKSINAAGMYPVGVHNQFAKQRLGVTQDLSEAKIQVDALSQLTYR